MKKTLATLSYAILVTVTANAVPVKAFAFDGTIDDSAAFDAKENCPDNLPPHDRSCKKEGDTLSCFLVIKAEGGGTGFEWWKCECKKDEEPGDGLTWDCDKKNPPKKKTSSMMF